MPTLVSIIVPAYNLEGYLAMTLDSLLAQTYPHFEVIVWDDGSTDASVPLAQTYAVRDSRVRVVAARHQGCCRSMQAAFALTTGTYIAWVDSDDYLAPTALAETVQVLDAHPHIGLVYTDYREVDAHNQDLGLGRRCRVPFSQERLLVDFMTFHFRLMRRSTFDQVGGINPHSGLATDYDLCLRLSEVTGVDHLPHPLYYYRIHPHNTSRQRQLDMIQDSQAAVERALQRRGLADRFQLVVQVTQKDGYLDSRFAIQQQGD